MTTVPLYRQIHLEILRDIRAGALKPGDRVPSENELAHRFNVSRITSKKALEELARGKLIVRIQGQGSFVSDPLPDLSVLWTESSEGESLLQNDRHGISTVGFILPDFDHVYGTRLFRAVERRSAHLGHQLLVRLTYGKSDAETKAIRSFIDAGVAGLIVFPVAGEYYNPMLLQLAVNGFPVVVVDRYLKGIPAHTVHTNNVKAAYEITNYLLDRGHTQLAFLSPPAEDTSTIEERIQGFVQAFSHRGLSLRPEHCFDKLTSTLPESFTAQNIAEDKARVQALIKQNPDLSAFVASEYNVALVARQAIQDIGYAVPRDVAIVCFDSPENPIEVPTFTHIQQDETSMGTVAADVVDALIRKEAVALRSVIDFKLVEGQST
jgi:DNA-binding LacI/PurR family transcriptional regulator/DNA-binding transcriptional regulator YhcF (GntR family)